MINTDEDGFLVCYHEGLPHVKCDHIRDWVANRSDADGIVIDSVTQVPVSLSLKGTTLQIPVYIDCEDGKTPPCEVHVQYLSQVSAKVYEPYIGLLSKGEGRLVLRSMIWDWLLGKYPENYDSGGMIMTPCPASIHNYNARLWMERPHKPWEVMECLWYIEMEGCCTYCWSTVDPSATKIDPSDVAQQRMARPTRSGYRGPNDAPGYLARAQNNPTQFSRAVNMDPKRLGKTAAQESGPVAQYTVLPDGKILTNSTGQVVMPNDLANQNANSIGIEVAKPGTYEIKFDAKLDQKTMDVLMGKDSIKGHEPKIQVRDEVQKWAADMQAKAEKNIVRAAQEEMIKRAARDQMRRNGY